MSASKKRAVNVLGKQVARHRLRLGLSRPALAARLGINRTYMWRIEQGEVLPSLPLCEQMASEFKVTVDALFRPPRSRTATA